MPQGLASLYLPSFTTTTASMAPSLGLGHPQQPYHLECATQRGHYVSKAPTQDHLLVFYLPVHDEWEASCTRMLAAGFRRVPSYNPYWEAQGQTFEDLDE